MATNRFTGSVSSTSNVAGNWSLGVVPATSDGHVSTWDASSPNCTIGGSLLYCQNVDFSAYTGTLTFASNYIIMNGTTLTLGASMTFAGTTTIFDIRSTTLTITSNGKVLTGNFNITTQNTNTITLVGNLSLGSLNNTLVTGLTLNKTSSETLTCTNITTGASGNTIQGTAPIYITSGTIDGGTGTISNDVYLNGNVTVANNGFSGNLYYTSGTLTNTSSLIRYSGAGNFDLNSLLINDLTISGSGTKTLGSNFNVKGLLQINTTSTNMTLNGYAINTGSLLSNLTSGSCAGTTVINLTGLGVNASQTGISNTITTATPTVNLFTGATNVNTNTSTNWSLGTVPTATDGYITTFLNTAPNATVNATLNCNAINFNGGTGYAGTLTMTTGINAYGNVTLSSSMGMSGAGTLGFYNTLQLTSNGKTWANTTTVNSSGRTIYLFLNGDWAQSLAFMSTTASSIFKLSTEKFGCLGLTATSAISGTAKIQINGGTWSGSGIVSNNVDFNGNTTISGSVAVGLGTITRTTGTITTTGSTVVFSVSNTLNVTGITWNNISFENTGNTYTLSGALTINGALKIGENNSNIKTFTLSGAYDISCATLTTGGAAQITLNTSGNINVSGVTTSQTSAIFTINNNTINCNGGLTLNGSINGTSTIAIGGGTWTGAGYLYSTASLTGCTLATSVNKYGGVLTLGAGITITSSTVNIYGSTTINGAGYTLLNIAFNSIASILKLSSTLNITGLIDSSTISSAWICRIESDTNGVQRQLILGTNVTFNAPFLAIKDIDSSGGIEGFTYKGTITNSLNWRQMKLYAQPTAYTQI